MYADDASTFRQVPLRGASLKTSEGIVQTVRVCDTYRALVSCCGRMTTRTIECLAGPRLSRHPADSRPAVSQHLRVLKGAEWVVESIAGTRRLYRINRSGLQVVRDYFDRFWETALDNFAILAAAEAEADIQACETNPVRSDEGRTDEE